MTRRDDEEWSEMIRREHDRDLIIIDMIIAIAFVGSIYGLCMALLERF